MKQGQQESTRIKQERYLEALARLGVRRKAADAVDIPTTTVYGWRRDDPTFPARETLAMRDSVSRLETVAWSIAEEDRNPKMVMWLLERLDKETYGDTRKTDAAPTDGKTTINLIGTNGAESEGRLSVPESKPEVEESREVQALREELAAHEEELSKFSAEDEPHVHKALSNAIDKLRESLVILLRKQG